MGVICYPVMKQPLADIYGQDLADLEPTPNNVNRGRLCKKPRYAALAKLSYNLYRVDERHTDS